MIEISFEANSYVFYRVLKDRILIVDVKRNLKNYMVPLDQKYIYLKESTTFTELKAKIQEAIKK